MKKGTAKICKVIAAIILIIVLPIMVYGSLLLFKPLCRSNSGVRSYVMKRIPIGTNWDDAERIIADNKWTIEEISNEYGLRINDSAENVSFASSKDIRSGVNNNNGIRIVGTKALRVKLGEYSLPFHTAVFAYLAFDENGQLIDAAIRRDIDAP